MLESVIHVFQRHLRPALLLMLVAAILTFGSMLLTDGIARYRADAALREQQRLFEARIRSVEEENTKARSAIEGLQEKVITAPFPLESVVPAIARLICIDNKDEKTYFVATGTVIDTGGLILTNGHALSSLDGSLIKYCGVGFTADLQTPPIIEYVAMVSAMHRDTDLALLQITEHLDGSPLPEAFPAITLGDPGKTFIIPALGETVFIGGYPGIGADTFTFTQGVVSGHVGKNLIKTSALIDSGTSGGAVFDQRGRYIGVATAAVQGDIGGSLGYLISAGVVDDFLKEYYAGNTRLEE